MYQSDLQNETSKVIIKELKEMFDRIDFHVREPETGNFHIPAWAKEEHMEQSVSEKELWSYENNKKRGDKIMKKSVLLLILTAMVITASTSIFTLIAMLCSNKAYSVAGCILLIFFLLFMGIRITSALNEPEYYSAYSYTENGVTVEEDEERNPNYLSGTKREVFEFLNEFLPGGQMLKLSTMKVDHLERSAVYDGIIFVVTTACGLLVFRRKDLK